MESIKKHIKGEKFIFDKSGSIFLENLSTLIFSDLHLGKGLTFANQGNLVPPFDLDETLFNLENIINKLLDLCCIYSLYYVIETIFIKTKTMLW